MAVNLIVAEGAKKLAEAKPAKGGLGKLIKFRLHLPNFLLVHFLVQNYVQLNLKVTNLIE